MKTKAKHNFLAFQWIFKQTELSFQESWSSRRSKWIKGYLLSSRTIFSNCFANEKLNNKHDRSENFVWFSVEEKPCLLREVWLLQATMKFFKETFWLHLIKHDTRCQRPYGIKINSPTRRYDLCNVVATPFWSFLSPTVDFIDFRSSNYSTWTSLPAKAKQTWPSTRPQTISTHRWPLYTKPWSCPTKFGMVAVIWISSSAWNRPPRCSDRTSSVLWRPRIVSAGRRKRF